MARVEVRDVEPVVVEKEVVVYLTMAEAYALEEVLEELGSDTLDDLYFSLPARPEDE